MSFLPPTNKVCEGYVFTHVCHSFCSQGGGIPACTAGGIPACLAGLQAHTRGEVEGSGQRGSPGSQLGGLQAHSWGVSRPTPGGCPGPHLRGYPSMYWGRHPPPSRQLLLWAVCILLECISVFCCFRRFHKVLRNFMLIPYSEMTLKSSLVSAWWYDSICVKSPAVSLLVCALRTFEQQFTLK